MSRRTSRRPRSDIAFPFRADRRGRTAHATHGEHVHDLIEQLLFTSPGERVMRPDFGCGLLDLVFAPTSPELISTLELSVQASLQRWLGDLIEVEALDVVSEDHVVRVYLSYVIRADGARRDDVFEGRATA
ncbi:GPW/gp25 family protein [Streptomyces sp. ISL-22]|uniref:Putative GPW/gp25 family protein n=1 Tax=Streptomyces viridochromogenes Tue57 TaxID=1160705 RepID=L8P1B3_STRVR|nr:MULTISPECIES: GPW/gp25 family protein [Streptomyces]ELS51361.1 putative GPW/gp25 family protein [Streptomyces viridochromogenes Tue57]MBT2421946.1 GPW/gp25 family protein [Streptomyces sp. ISL-24]MBT2436381.1 GPW/gp25 family protein [Streptomyces sp. ISL-22]